MSTVDLVFVVGAALIALVICSLPGLATLGRAGPRYRAATVRYLLVGWAAAALVGVWLVLGFTAVASGGRWWAAYRDFTLVLMGAYPVLLVVFIRAGNRSLAAARTADAAA